MTKEHNAAATKLKEKAENLQDKVDKVRARLPEEQDATGKISELHATAESKFRKEDKSPPRRSAHGLMMPSISSSKMWLIWRPPRPRSRKITRPP